MGLSTDDVMAASLDLVGWEAVPADSAVYVPGADLETALVGIDLESAELQLAAREGYDLVLTHHPVGGDARLAFPDVLDRQVTFMTDRGVPAAEAEAAVADLREAFEYGGHSANYRHDPSVAEHLDQPYMNVHLAPDELGRRAFRAVVDDLPPGATVADLQAAFDEAFPEIRDARTDVECRVGDPANELGEVAVHHAAGTNGGAPVARGYFEHGVDTVLYIHVGADDARDLREEHGDEKNLIVTGHIASDAVGMNEYVAELASRGLDCTRISGLKP
jgi:hypothetical protein